MEYTRVRIPAEDPEVVRERDGARWDRCLEDDDVKVLEDNDADSD